MRITDLIEDAAPPTLPHEDYGDEGDGLRANFHDFAVNEAMCEMFRNYKSTASNPPSLISHGRSGCYTIEHTINRGRFSPPAGSKLHGFVCVDSGVECQPRLNAEIVCSPTALTLVVFCTVETYEALLEAAHLPSRCQTSLFQSPNRAKFFYNNVERAQQARVRTAFPSDFYVLIPNGLAFLRVFQPFDTVTEPHPIHCPFGLEPVGLFRYYEGKTDPHLRCVLQVSNKALPARTTQPAPRPALEAIYTFLTQRYRGDGLSAQQRHDTEMNSWSGAPVEAQRATASETAAVVGERVVVLAHVRRGETANLRLKRALESMDALDPLR
jgi:hypothetical protein